MLRKLFKYEWKAVSLLLFILHGGLLIYTLIGRIGYQIYFSRSHISDTAALMTGLYIFFYMLGIFAIALTTIVYLAVHMQKNLFSDEGYLTHTLPVTSDQLLCSKIFVFWLWMILDTLIVLSSICILLINKDTWPELSYGLSRMWDIILSASAMSDVMTSVMYSVNGITQYFFFFTGLLIFSICVGSLFKNHKILGSVVCFFGTNMINSVITMLITSFLFSGEYISNGISAMSTSMNGLQTSSMALNIFSIIWNLGLTAVFYMVSRFILSKRLNLE